MQHQGTILLNGTAVLKEISISINRNTSRELKTWFGAFDAPASTASHLYQADDRDCEIVLDDGRTGHIIVDRLGTPSTSGQMEVGFRGTGPLARDVRRN